MTGDQFPRQYARRPVADIDREADAYALLAAYQRRHVRRHRIATTARWWTPLPQAAIYPKDRT